MFLAIQLVLAAVVEHRPELGDPIFGYRLASLRRQLAHAPERPLILFIGSSRTEAGVCADLINERSDDALCR